jgi:hypothetical protein
MDWIGMAKNRDRRRALVNADKRLGFIKCERFFD